MSYRIDFDYDPPLETNQGEFFDICVDCYDMMNGLIIKNEDVRADLSRPKSPSDMLKMQPIFTRLTSTTPPSIPTQPSKLVTNIELTDNSNTTPSNKNFSRNNLKLDLKPVYTSNQIKNP